MAAASRQRQVTFLPLTGTGIFVPTSKVCGQSRIVLIVGYHAGVPGFSGGFVGVDVFFVISGFLITRLLLRDSAAAGSVPFSEFWARRIRRLVPGLALMVVATLLASLVIINPFDMLETAKEGAASGSLRLEPSVRPDIPELLCLQSEQEPLPTHMVTRSGGAVLCDLAIFCGGPAASLSELPSHDESRRPHLVRCNFPVSFALNVLWTNEGSSWAFFSLPTRAWEFAAGGLPWISYHSSVATQVRSGGVGICWARHSGRRCRDLQLIHDISPYERALSRSWNNAADSRWRRQSWQLTRLAAAERSAHAMDWPSLLLMVFVALAVHCLDSHRPQYQRHAAKDRCCPCFSRCRRRRVSRQVENQSDTPDR